MGFGMPGMPSPGTASMLVGLEAAASMPQGVPQQLGMPHFVAPPEVQMTMPMATGIEGTEVEGIGEPATKRVKVDKVD